MRARSSWSVLVPVLVPVLLTAAATACGGASESGPDGGAGVDGAVGVDAPPSELSCATERRAGRLHLEPRGLNGSVQSRATLTYFPGIRPTMTAGACKLWSSQPDFCDPACGGLDECVDGVCLPEAVNLPVGTITVTLPGDDLVSEPTEFGYYADGSKDVLWQSGDPIHLAAEGDGPISGFEADLTGTGVVVIEGATPGRELALVEGVGLTMRWSPTVPGSRVLLHMYSDHHGAPGFIQCEVDDAAGEIVVARELGDALIALGASGIGTYVEGAWTSRQTRALIERETGCVEVVAKLQTWIQVETVRAQ